MSTAITNQSASYRWIGGRRFDLLFFFGSTLAAVLAGGLALAVPGLAVPMWLAWLWLLDGPHLIATWARTYGDAEQRQRHRRLLMTSLLWILPGFVALAVCAAVNDDAPFNLYLAFAAVWSYHHAVRQYYGIAAIYQRLARAEAQERRIDNVFLYGTLWSSFALFLLGYSNNRRSLGLTAATGTIEAIILVVGGLLASAVLAYVVHVFRRAHRARPVLPALFILFSALGTTAFAFFVIAPFEPLAASAQTPEQFFITVAMVGGIVHGVQYLALVLIANKRRFSVRQQKDWSVHLGRLPMLSYVCFVVVALAYLALNLARGAVPDGSWFDEHSRIGQFFLALYWGIFFHHYYLDQKIWRVGKDSSLKYELGLQEHP